MISANTEIHPTAVIHESATVWAFTVIGEGVLIGPNAVIGSHCYVGKGSTLGQGVHVQSGVFLPNHSTIEDFVFIGPHVVFTDDRYPRAGNTAYFAEPPIVRAGASIGAGAVILPGVEIGAGAMIGAGAVVTHSVPMGDLSYGVPARAQHQTLSQSA